MIFGKLYNARWSVERTRRDHGLRIDGARLEQASARIKALLPLVAEETSLDALRGLEGTGATAYFSVLDEMILGEKPVFSFPGRSRRPPLDPVNAMLSFSYSLLAHDCAGGFGKAWDWTPMWGFFTGTAGKKLPGIGSDGRASPLYG